MALIELTQVSKAYETEAGDFLALKNINLSVGSGEFVAVIGKSGSGKSTLVNMITGIDRPSAGNVVIAQTALNDLDEGAMARWRGQHLGIVFQFFQLLPTLTVIENVLLPMDFGQVYEPPQRIKRALSLLDMVEISSREAHKLPSQLSGGQQQRVAIARALANNPPLIAADEPTGNLDSKTAGLVFDLFGRLVSEGKTIIMVTHDRDLAERVSRTLVIADGEIIEEYLARTFPGLTEKQLVLITSKLQPVKYAPGQVILKKGDPVKSLYIVTKGQIEIFIQPTHGREFVVATYGRGQYFGEIELLQGEKSSLATAKVSSMGSAEVASLDLTTLQTLMSQTSALKRQLTQEAAVRFEEHQQKTKA